ncbi:MAG: T9SS type A sorting domain-containing protein [Chitinophagales bacterium]|nr:T9SS type A sorting domain-containing protein [Chitinophagales bacterium]
MKRSLLSAALLAGVMSANAQSVVKDINPGTTGSFPYRMAAFGKNLVFTANDGTNGYELWLKDTSGTNLAFNINPAAASSFSSTQNRTMAVVGKNIYFPANNGTSGTELYRWDGTNPPTLAAEVYAGTSSAGVDEVVAYKGKVYFDANDGNYGEELWVYDTTGNIAMRLTDISAGASSSFISSIAVYDTLVYFSAYTVATGQELYAYNPTTNSTTLVSDIEAGSGSSAPNNLIVIGNKLYFSATTTSFGRELYSYNGLNVMRLTDVAAGNLSTITNYSIGQRIIAGFNNKIYFAGNDGTNFGHLYVYDPATGNTALVYKTNPTGNSNISNIHSAKNRIYFNADNGVNGNELWMYKGTGVPAMVADIYTGAISSNPAEFLQMGTTIYFRAADSANGTELFMLSDSTLGVKNVAFNADVKVYPNPTTGNATLAVTLEKTQALNVSVTDMAGRVVYNSGVVSYVSGKNEILIPAANMANGIYIYAIRSENGELMASGRFQKQ